MKRIMSGQSCSHGPSKTKVLVVLLAIALVASFAAWGCSPKAANDDAKAPEKKAESAASEKAGDGVDELAAYSGFPTEGPFIDNVAALPGSYKNTEKNEANATATSCNRSLPMSWDGTIRTSMPTNAGAHRATRWRTR